MYSELDVSCLKTSIDDLMTCIKKTKLDKIKDEIKITRDMIFDYIKTHNRKLYGGLALEYLIKDINPSEIIYDELDIPDIDFYSPDPIEDLIQICNLLKDLKYVRGREAMHKETYCIYVNNKLYANITYVPKNIYAKIPFKTIKEFTITHPQFMIIDYFRIFTDPFVSYWRLFERKAFERYLKLDAYYPFPMNNKPIDVSELKSKDEIKREIFELTKDNDNLIHVGFTGYNYYVRESESTKYNQIDEKYYEIISMDLKSDSKLICDKLKEKYEIKIIENFPFFQYIGHSVSIYSPDDILLCVLYSHNNRCVPFAYDSVNKINIASHNYVIMHMLACLMKYRVQNQEYLKQLHYKMVSNMMKLKESYIKESKDISLFKDFTLDIKGETLPPEKERQIIGEARKKNNKAYLFNYEPAHGIKEEKTTYIFSNTSGNPVVNPMKSIFYEE